MVFHVLFKFTEEAQVVDCVLYDSFLQGEVGEPGQKGSKADKGEQVGYGRSILSLQCFTHMKYTML